MDRRTDRQTGEQKYKATEIKILTKNYTKINNLICNREKDKQMNRQTDKHMY